ncbi:MAG: shikimate kinase [Alphaproteobacteria bacterium]
MSPEQLRRLRSQTLVLVGLMGAGKTTVGRRLAHTLDMPFKDSDVEIEVAAGCPIPDIFSTFGESYFRDGERRVIERLLNDPPHVLATGGGAFVQDRTRALIRGKAVSIWLRADLDLLVRRVSRRDTRPLLRNGDPAAIMRRLLDERAPLYAEADVMVDTDDGPHDVVVRRILSAVDAFLQRRKAPQSAPVL